MREVSFERGVVIGTKGFACGVNLASRCYDKHNLVFKLFNKTNLLDDYFVHFVG